MPQLIIAALILWALVAGLRGFARADPKALARGVKRGGGGAALVAAGLLLVLRGNIETAAALGALGVWLLGWSQTAPGFLRNFGFGGVKPSGPRLFRSRLLEIEADPAGGRLDGRVLAGHFAGRRLSELSESDCAALLSECGVADPDGRRLLEAYLDRRFPGRRAAGEGHQNAGRQQRSGSQSMSEDNAYQLLGLAKGASREEISHAHRTLMKKVHPDHGGTASLAALLNEAKDVLMRDHG